MFSLFLSLPSHIVCVFCLLTFRPDIFAIHWKMIVMTFLVFYEEWCVVYKLLDFYHIPEKAPVKIAIPFTSLARTVITSSYTARMKSRWDSGHLGVVLALPWIAQSSINSGQWSFLSVIRGCLYLHPLVQLWIDPIGCEAILNVRNKYFWKYLCLLMWFIISSVLLMIVDIPHVHTVIFEAICLMFCDFYCNV